MAKVIRLPKGSTLDGVVDAAEPKTLGKRVRPETGKRVAVLSPEIGWARLTADDDPSLTVLCELGDGYPRVTQGYGGFETVARQQDVALTPWRGFDPLAIELPLWIDDLTGGRSVEPVVDVLEALAGRGRRRTRTPDGGYVKPPAVIVHTGGVMPYDAHAFPDMRWSVNALDFDDEETITNDAGNRIRVPVTVTLLQRVEPARLQSASMRALAQRQQNNKKGRGARRYTARKGDTAMSIARGQLGDAGRYVEILKLNGLRDPRAIREGAVLKIPR
jgi:hypothetical protein